LFLPNPGLGGHGQIDHHHRGSVAGLQPSSAEGMACRTGAAMRLLPKWPDHERGRPAQAQSEAEPRADRGAYEHQHLPVRDLPAHRARCRARREGGLTMNAHNRTYPTALSRRHVMIGAAGLSFAFAAGQGADAAVIASEKVGQTLSPWVSIAADG